MAAARTFGEELRRFRTLLGLSQEGLADLSGVSVRTIRSLERDDGRRRRAPTLGRLFEALELDESDRTALLERYEQHHVVAQDSPAAGSGTLDVAEESVPTDVGLSVEDAPESAIGEVGALVRDLRSRMGWTQRELAGHARVHYRTVSNLERGITSGAHPGTAFRLGQAGGLRGDELERFVESVTGTAVHGDAGAVRADDVFGRVEEFAALLELLGSNRLVTITGGGGIGKTTLARAALWASDGSSVSVELADQPARQPLLLALAEALSIDANTVGELARQLDSVELLLIDNVEHLVDVGAVITELLDELPGIRMILTSRWAVVDGDERGALLSLDALDPAAAVSLLRQRAADAGCADSWAADDQPYGAICASLDHLPLAIELAAAWSVMMSPSELLERLEGSIALLDRRRGGGTRHDSVRAAIAWTVELLSSGAQRLFAELSLHPTSLTLDLIESVHGETDDVMEALGELVEVGLVEVMGAVSPSRFRMLRVVREAGADMLHDPERLDELRRRRSAWVVDLLSDVDGRLTGSEQTTWLRRLDLEREHITATFDDLIELGSLDALHLGAGMWRYWQLRSLYERGRERLSDLLSISGAPGSDLLWTVSYGRAVLGYLGGHIDEAIVDATNALDGYRHLDDQHGVGSVHSLLGMIEHHRGNDLESERWYRAGIAAISARSAPRAFATLQTNLSSLLAQRGELDEALDLIEEAIARFERLGDERGVADNTGNMALWELATGRPESARLRASSSLVVFERMGDPQGQADSFLALAEAALFLDEFDEARAHVERAAAITEEIADPWNIPMIAAYRSLLALGGGDGEVARREARRACVDADDLPYPHAQVRAHAADALARIEHGRLRQARDAVKTALGHAQGHVVVSGMMVALAGGLVRRAGGDVVVADRLVSGAQGVLGDVAAATIVRRAVAFGMGGPSDLAAASAVDCDLEMLRDEALELLAAI